jgi:CheY-like chemotaxis protein
MEKAGELLKGRSILIVEDEMLVAMALEDLFRQLGCEVLGPANSVERALSMLERMQPDVALLDLNLNGEPVTPVARALTDRGVPFVVTSGYSDPALQEPELRAAPKVDKPFRQEVLARTVAAALSSR